jgi:glycyl-tRNA synthetase beta chain
MARDVLFEIGTEELPASFVRHALALMQETAKKLFEEARLAPSGEIRALGTPRRLTLVIEGVPDSQPDREETVQGPPWSVAFGVDDKPSPAGIGYAKKQGIDVAKLRKLETPKGVYVGFDVSEKGKPAQDVLGPLLTELGKRITFPKAMRWGQGDHAFGRPVQWLVALFGKDVIEATVAGVSSGRVTRGHRFLAPDPFEIASPDVYVARMEKAHVVVDVKLRRERMMALLEAAARKAGGEVAPDEFLFDECAMLVEEPFVVPGTIDAQFLDLPDDVIVSVMRNHQRYLAVRDAKTKKLLPTYLNVVGTANDPETIARGNDRVLRARLGDARFFVSEDQKHTLASRVARLDGIVFQAKLGTVGDKADRIATLAAYVSGMAEGDADARAPHVARAAMLAKTDLVTYIVGEFPELQGEMGRYYAEREGEAPEVCEAIRDHYRPAGAEDSVAKGIVAAAVAVADRADTLVGCFAINLVPTGNADPFALRRAALGIVRTALEGPIDVTLASLLARAYDAHVEGQKAKGLKPKDLVLASLDEFVRGRLRALYRERNPVDIVDACLAAWDGESLRVLDKKLAALSRFRESPAYATLAVAFKRAYNISKDTAPGALDDARFEAGPERDLAAAFTKMRPTFDSAIAEGRYEDALASLGSELRTPIDVFFDKVFVMVDDAAVRENRLRLLRSIADAVNQIASFHLLAS